MDLVIQAYLRYVPILYKGIINDVAELSKHVYREFFEGKNPMRP